VKLWDTRGKLPLHTVNAHPNERAMAVDFHGPDRVVSGGTDGKLRTFKIARPEALDDAAGDDEDDA
jgi:ribosome biogenesis protein YTM1